MALTWGLRLELVPLAWALAKAPAIVTIDTPVLASWMHTSTEYPELCTTN
jgi:hypothetical protein